MKKSDSMSLAMMLWIEEQENRDRTPENIKCTNCGLAVTRFGSGVWHYESGLISCESGDTRAEVSQNASDEPVGWLAGGPGSDCIHCGHGVVTRDPADLFHAESGKAKCFEQETVATVRKDRDGRD